MNEEQKLSLLEEIESFSQSQRVVAPPKESGSISETPTTPTPKKRSRLEIVRTPTKSSVVIPSTNEAPTRSVVTDPTPRDRKPEEKHCSSTGKPPNNRSGHLDDIDSRPPVATEGPTDGA